MEQHFIPITKKARYLTLGNPMSSKIMIVLHGYGQLAEFFIQKFEALTQNGYLVVAPEGTHRYYQKGSSGRVGASWMTKELREIDITENNQYLSDLLQYLLENNAKTEISILGFSQGGATAVRWLATPFMKNLSKKGSIIQFILWASVFPPDINFNDFELKNTNKTFVIGKQDEFYPSDNQLEIIEFYKNIDFSTIHFEGRHEIDQKTLILLTNNSETNE